MDVELVRRQLVESRTAAQEAISAGLVTIDGAPAFKAATQISATQSLKVSAPPRAYVSRGGEKLAYALDRFAVDPADRVALDAGVSTGGFTDCLLQRGAQRVIAYDVGYGQIHERLRTDPRVVLFERTNVRSVRPDDVPPPAPDLLVADLSFISLAMVLPVLRTLVDQTAEAVVLVKPQFEADRGDVGDGGIVRDPQVWRRALERVAAAGAALDWDAAGICTSPLLGGSGNVEFLLHLVPAGIARPDAAAPATSPPATPPPATSQVDTMIEDAVAEGRQRRAGRGPEMVETAEQGRTT